MKAKPEVDQQRKSSNKYSTFLNYWYGVSQNSIAPKVVTILILSLTLNVMSATTAFTVLIVIKSFTNSTLLLH